MSTATQDTRATAAARPAFIAELVDRLDLRANSLIITIFGDALLPRGGAVWLGSLIELAACFGISERLVRTGVYRLAKDGWLSSQTRGRRAYYALTPTGQERFEEAQQRIYALEPPAWTDQWHLVHVLPDMEQTERQALRRELGLLGMGQVSPTLFGHPAADDRVLRRTLADLGLSAKVVTFRASIEGNTTTDAVRRMVRESWPLEDLGKDYLAFENHFREIPELIESTQGLKPRDCFALRILLIHDYRRILLKDPRLPDELLSPGWPGRRARELCAALYRTVVTEAEKYIDDHVETLEGPPRPAGRGFHRRFGGL